MPSVEIDTHTFDALVSDLDGVVTDTASVHLSAWREMFDAFLAEREGLDRPSSPFTRRDYERYVDGRPRYDGVAAFLASRGIALPYGDPRDPGGSSTICALGNRKDRMFADRLAREGPRVFLTTVSLLNRARALGLRTAVISASRHCSQVLDQAHLSDLFDAQVDGRLAGLLGLRGKPEPDVFLEAARRLRVDPRRAVVLEDAEAGVEAGRRGGFGLVIGVDRTGHAEALAAHGADVVVTDLGEVRLDGHTDTEVADAAAAPAP